MENLRPVIIIGMARSGTTLVGHIFGSLPNVHIEAEPHALWKSGNFKFFNDEEYNLNKSIVQNIRRKLTKKLNGKVLVEKSPNNSLKPLLVHAVFPDAKIVYIERDPIRCIYSNYKRSINKDSFKLSIIVKKYFVYTGSKDLEGAISNRKLYQQISWKDIPDFIRYVTRMFYLRRLGLLPFGPKLKQFDQIVKKRGLLEYHVQVYKAAVEYKQQFKNLYGSNMEVFSLEKVMAGTEEIKRMVDFSEIPYNAGWLDNIHKTFDKERVVLSKSKNEIDRKIEILIKDMRD